MNTVAKNMDKNATTVFLRFRLKNMHLEDLSPYEPFKIIYARIKGYLNRE